MVVNELHIRFREGVDKANTLNNPNFLPEQIDLYLSDAQEEFIEQRAFGNNFKKESLEETQKRVKDLQSITKNAVITNFVNNPDNKPSGTFVELPSDYRHAINEEIVVEYTDCNKQKITQRVSVVALTHDKYNKTFANPFTRPTLNTAYRLPYGRMNNKEYFEIITNPDHTLKSYILRYLKNPEKINLAQRIIPPSTTPFGLSTNQTGEMTDEAYREIIRIAVRNALGDIQAPGVQEAMERNKEVE